MKAILMVALLLALPAIAAEKAQEAITINWDGPRHLIDDFEKEKACKGFHYTIKGSVENYTLKFWTPFFEFEGTSVPDHCHWAVITPEGKLAETGDTLLWRNAVKDACKELTKILSKARESKNPEPKTDQER